MISTNVFRTAQEGKKPIVNILLEAGADVNMANAHGNTPLFVAAQNGHDVVVITLLQAGADANKANKTGKTPLFFAAIRGTLGVAREPPHSRLCMGWEG